MKRTLVGAAATVAAVTAAGIAVAHGVDGGKSVKAVAGGFNATTASKVTTRTCTTTDHKTIVTTDGTYTGAATGDPDLTGNITVHARSTINSTDNVGIVTGRLKIDVASGRDSEADFTGTWASSQFAGLAVGHAHDPAAKLIANISGGFTAAGGFTNAKLGATAGGGAVELLPAGCATTKTVRERSEARGIVSALGNGSITVAGLTCTVPASLQSKLTGLAVNSHAAIKCALVNGVNTLTDIDKLR
jgi:hypothetical protein